MWPQWNHVLIHSGRVSGRVLTSGGRVAHYTTRQSPNLYPSFSHKEEKYTSENGLELYKLLFFFTNRLLEDFGCVRCKKKHKSTLSLITCIIILCLKRNNTTTGVLVFVWHFYGKTIWNEYFTLSTSFRLFIFR